MTTNKELYKSDELLARAFDWYCSFFDCNLCKHSKLKRKHNSRTHCFLAWQKDEADTALILEPCRFCGTEVRPSYGSLAISCSRCGYEVRWDYGHPRTASLGDTAKKLVDMWNRLQKGDL